jgi:hypothetical protein
VGVELLPALVPGVERLEEGDRVGDVDDDREVKLCGGGPERIEAPVVDRDETAVGIARPQSEQLPDLEPARSPRRGVPQPGRLRLSERRVSGPAVVVEAREDRDPIRICRLPSIDLRRQRVALAAVQVDDHLDARLVECRDQLRRGTRRPVTTERRAEVVVRVDDGIPRPANLVNLNAE